MINCRNIKESHYAIMQLFSRQTQLPVNLLITFLDVLIEEGHKC